MPSRMYEFLNTELTPIPEVLKGILGANFNNTLCNGITWLFVLWVILYVCYDKLINIYFKHLKLPQYLRSRYTRSIWDFSMSTCFLACFIFYTSNKYPSNKWRVMSFFDHQQDKVSLLESCTFAGLCSSLLANGCIHGVQRSFSYLVKFAALVVACSFAYVLGFPDMAFALAALLAFTGMWEEMTRLSFCRFYKTGKIGKSVVHLIFIDNLLLSCIIYFYLIPVGCLFPLVSMRLPENSDFLRLPLFMSLLCGVNLVIFQSPAVNSISHQVFHSKKCDKEHEKTSAKLHHPRTLTCLGNLIECALFPPRTDDGFVMAFLRSEEENRKIRLNAKRKPKNKNMIIQTLKFITLTTLSIMYLLTGMLTIKKKLSQKLKRRSDESSDSSEAESIIDSDSDNSSASHESSSEVNASSKMMELQPKSEDFVRPLEDSEEDFEAIESEISNESLEKAYSDGSAKERENSAQSEIVEKLKVETEAVERLVEGCEASGPITQDSEKDREKSGHKTGEMKEIGVCELENPEPFETTPKLKD